LESPTSNSALTLVDLISTWLDLGDLLSHDDRVALANFLGTQSLVVEAAFVLVAVSVHRTEHASASTGEPSKPHFLLASQAPAFLFLSVLVAIVVLARTVHLTPVAGAGCGTF